MEPTPVPAAMLAVVKDPDCPPAMRMQMAYSIVLRRHTNAGFWAMLREEYEAELVKHGIAEFDPHYRKIMVEV